MAAVSGKLVRGEVRKKIEMRPGPEVTAIVGSSRQQEETHPDTYRVVLDSLYDGVYFVDCNREIQYWNLSAERLTGYAASEMLGHRCFDDLLSHVDEDGERLCFGRCPLQASIEDGKLREAKVYLRHRDGHREAVMVRTAPIRNAHGDIVGGVEIFNTDRHLLAVMSEVSDLKRQACRDALTGLGNRRLMQRALRRKAHQLSRYGRPYSVLFVDIDHFKDFNDAWGHAAGDAALKAVALALRRRSRETDIVVRWGGEEFVVLLGSTGAEGIEVAAERYRSLIESTVVRWQGRELTVSVSVGGATAKAGEGPAAVLARADAALYRSKKNGRNRVTIDRD